MENDFGGGEDIRFERIGKAGVVTLTRPKALNALNHRMVKALAAAFEAWENDRAVQVVVIKGEGRAFCAGGDIAAVYHAGRDGNPSYDFFADEYRLNAQLARFPKPCVSLIDGIVMGGGVGIAFHGSHRVMTENALFAMPETGIGFFPDIGGSFLLSHLPGSFGMYLGLTGARIRRGDALWCGLATHAVDAAVLPELLGELTMTGNVRAALRSRAIKVARETDDAVIHDIPRYFGGNSLEAVVASLEAGVRDSDEFARTTLETLRKRSPTSLHVTFREIEAGAMLSVEECLVMEYRILTRMLQGHDFYEGVRATLIDKGATPAWQPDRIEAVGADAVEAYFASLGDRELVL